MKKVGVSSLQRDLDSRQSYNTLSATVLTQQADIFKDQLGSFQKMLSQFAHQHRNKIASSPALRMHFNQLCTELGVDPLGGGRKSAWSKVGLGLRDWYYALAVQVVDVCSASRALYGGVLLMDQLIHAVSLMRNDTSVSEQDIVKAIDTLKPLNAGYEVVEIGNDKYVRCTPGILDTDSLFVLQACQNNTTGAVTRDELVATSQWNPQRVDSAIHKALMRDGLVWIDEDADGKQAYYAVALFNLDG